MKKILFLLMSVVLFTACTGCKQSKETPTTDSIEVVKDSVVENSNPTLPDSLEFKMSLEK